MKTSIAAAAAALLCSFAANAGALQRSFHVGAVVLASASVSSTVTSEAISVRTGGHRAPRAAVLMDGNLTVLAESTGTSLAAPASGDAVVTLLY